jgi:predicted GNAT family N-acyltransferase
MTDWWKMDLVPWETTSDDLLSVRHTVFVEEQGVPVEEERDKHDAASVHFLARDASGHPIGTARLLGSGRIGRVAVLREWRGRGLGRALMAAVMAEARRCGMKRLHLHAQVQTIPFYESLGFVVCGNEFEEAGILHREMERSGPLLRLARLSDLEALESLIAHSVEILQAGYYNEAQRMAAMGPVFGVDPALIEDGTYWVAEGEDGLIAAGGWSRRKTLFGGQESLVREETFLDPEVDPARIRAFFVHPSHARKGLGSAILRVCEDEILAAGFREATMVATLAGEPLYTRHGYLAGERYEIPLPQGLSLPVVRMEKRLRCPGPKTR